MRKLSLLTILLSIAALSTGAAASAAASPSLSAAEYQQLLNFQTSSSTKSVKTLAGIVRTQRTACGALSPVSALMRADIPDCNATFEWLEDSVRALARAKVCAHRTSVAGRFGCLLPDYSKLSRGVRAMYHAEKRVYSAVLARGFSGACVGALSDNPTALKAEARMTTDITKMVSAIRRGAALAAAKWGSLYDAATAETEAAASKASVTVCPHQ
jgi:hypothetical protein